MAGDDESSGGLATLMAVGLIAACCGLPLLLGAGLIVGAVGVAVGSLAAIGGGAALAVWRWRRRRVVQRSGCRHDWTQRRGQHRELA